MRVDHTGYSMETFGLSLAYSFCWWPYIPRMPLPLPILLSDLHHLFLSIHNLLSLDSWTPNDPRLLNLLCSTLLPSTNRLLLRLPK